MKKTILVFDFDGTIADTFHHLVKISNQLSDEFNFKKMEFHELEGLKDKTSQEMIHHLHIPIMKIPLIVTKAKKELHKAMATIEPIEGLKNILLQLKDLGYKMGILTSNSMENVTEFLKRHELELFDVINATSKLWSKNHCLRNLIIKRI